MYIVGLPLDPNFFLSFSCCKVSKIWRVSNTSKWLWVAYKEVADHYLIKGDIPFKIESHILSCALAVSNVTAHNTHYLESFLLFHVHLSTTIRMIGQGSVPKPLTSGLNQASYLLRPHMMKEIPCFFLPSKINDQHVSKPTYA